MKKGNKNFKVLTKDEASQIKGGSWLSSFFSSVYSYFQGGGGGCPPPEPE